MTIGPAQQAKIYSKVDRRVIPFLFLCYILSYLDRVNIGFAKLQMAADLSLSDAAYGSGAGIFFIGYFLFGVPSNVLLKKFGARLWISRIMIVWGVISASMLFVTGEASFYVLRFILGFAEAGFFPGIILYLTLWYPSERRATRIAGFMLAVAMAGVIGNPVSGAVMGGLSGALGLAGWQWLFLIEGVPSIVVGIWVIFYLDSSIREAKWLSLEEKSLLAANIEAEDEHKTQHRLIDAFKSGRVYVLALIYFSLTIGLYGIGFWLPTIVAGFGVKDYLTIGLISAVPYVVASIGMLFLSRHSDRTQERRLHLAANTAIGAFALVLSGLFASYPVLAILFISIGTLGVIGSFPLFWPLPSAFLTGTASAAGIGIINSIGNLGGFVAPNIPVWVRFLSSDPSAALYAMAGTMFLGAAVTFLFIPSQSKPHVLDVPIDLAPENALR